MITLCPLISNKEKVPPPSVAIVKSGALSPIVNDIIHSRNTDYFLCPEIIRNRMVDQCKNDTR